MPTMNAMTKAKRARLKAAGFRFTTATEFLGLTQAESRMVELRVRIGRRIRSLRERQALTQQQLARQMRSSQSRVGKMESGASGVSIDLLLRGLFTLGGRIEDLVPARRRGIRGVAKTAPQHTETRP